MDTCEHTFSQSSSLAVYASTRSSLIDDDDDGGGSGGAGDGGEEAFDDADEEAQRLGSRASSLETAGPARARRRRGRAW